VDVTAAKGRALVNVSAASEGLVADEDTSTVIAGSATASTLVGVTVSAVRGLTVASINTALVNVVATRERLTTRNIDGSRAVEAGEASASIQRTNRASVAASGVDILAVGAGVGAEIEVDAASEGAVTLEHLATSKADSSAVTRVLAGVRTVGADCVNVSAGVTSALVNINAAREVSVAGEDSISTVSDLASASALVSVRTLGAVSGKTAAVDGALVNVCAAREGLIARESSYGTEVTGVAGARAEVRLAISAGSINVTTTKTAALIDVGAT